MRLHASPRSRGGSPPDPTPPGAPESPLDGIYLHMAASMLRATPSPLEALDIDLVPDVQPWRAPTLEVADIVRQYGDAYLARYGAVTSTTQRPRAPRHRAVSYGPASAAIKRSATTVATKRSAIIPAAIGTVPRPGSAQAAWLAARERELLEVPYCHVVFTLPSQLSAWRFESALCVYVALSSGGGDPPHDCRIPNMGAEIGFSGGLAYLGPAAPSSSACALSGPRRWPRRRWHGLAARAPQLLPPS